MIWGCGQNRNQHGHAWYRLKTVQTNMMMPSGPASRYSTHANPVGSGFLQYGNQKHSQKAHPSPDLLQPIAEALAVANIKRRAMGHRRDLLLRQRADHTRGRADHQRTRLEDLSFRND